MAQSGTPRRLLEKRWEKLHGAMRRAKLRTLVIASRGIIGQYGTLYYLIGYPLQLVHGYGAIQLDAPPTAILNRRDQYWARQRGLGDLLVPFRIEDAVQSFTAVTKSGRQMPPTVSALCEYLASQRVWSGRVGVVGMRTIMPSEDLECLEERFPRVRFEDATALYNSVKATKLPEEIRLFAQTTAIADHGYGRFRELIRPGNTEWQVAGEIEKTVREQGAMETLIFVLSKSQYTVRPTGRRIRKGDFIGAYVEMVGPSGFWVERGGMFSLGSPSLRHQRIYRACKEAFDAAVDLLRPGVKASTVANRIEEVARSNGYVPGIWSGHGVGVDHDMPAIAPSDHTTLEEDMLISIHPHLVSPDERLGATICDVFHVRTSGPKGFTKQPLELEIV